MAFTDELEPTATEYWDAICDHPMVRQLGEGTLDPEPFRYWVRQDYVYLIEYSRLFALAVANAPDLERMTTLATLLSSTLNEEMDLHREYAASFDITEAALEATTPSPTTQGYTDFLVRTAGQGSFGETIAALLPCMWGLHENLGQNLHQAARTPIHAPVRQTEGFAGGIGGTERTNGGAVPSRGQRVRFAC
jgi:thiaminase/transcriptional activator TenA